MIISKLKSHADPTVCERASVKSILLWVILPLLSGSCGMASPSPGRVTLINATDQKSGEVVSDSSLPLPTIDAILARPNHTGEMLGWVGNDALLVQVAEGKRKILESISLADRKITRISEASTAAASPDGSKVIEVVPKGWVIRDLINGQSRPIARPDGEQETEQSRPPVWSPDGRYAALVARNRPVALPTKPPIRTIDGNQVMDFDELAKATPTSRAYIAILDTRDAEPGKLETPQWHEVSERIGHVAWDEGGIYFSSAKFNVREPCTVISYLSLTGGEPREVYRSRGRFQSLKPIPSPDRRWLAVGIDADTRNWDAFVSIVLVDPKTGREVKRVTKDLPVLAYSMEWSHDGQEIHCVVRQGGLDQLASIQLDGTVRMRTSALRKHFNLRVSPDGKRFAYQTEDGYGRKDFRVQDLATGIEQVMLVLDDPTKEFQLASFQHVRWAGQNGVAPYGFLFLPPGFDPSRKYPLIVDVHGGGPGSSLYLMAPMTISVAPGPLEWHAWAALGYVVFVPDYQSTGYYGPIAAYRTPKPGRYYLDDDVDDVIAGTHFMFTQPFIDARRAGILGHSAGGQRTYNLITAHPLFAAAVINEGSNPDPVSLTLALTTGSYTGREFEGMAVDLLGATLSEAPESYKRNLMFDAYRIKAATLIMLGNPAKGGVGHLPHEVLFSILKAYHVPVRMLSFVDEGHTHATPASAKMAFNEAQRWFEKYLAPQP